MLRAVLAKPAKNWKSVSTPRSRGGYNFQVAAAEKIELPPPKPSEPEEMRAKIEAIQQKLRRIDLEAEMRWFKLEDKLKAL